MARRVDPGTAWAVYREAHEALAPWLASLPAEHWHGPSVLEGWTVADLAAHITKVDDALAVLGPAPRGAEANTISRYLSFYGQNASSIADATRDVAAACEQRPEKIIALLTERFAAATASVEGFGARDQVVNSRRGPVRLGDFIVTRVIEIVIHADDLSRSVSGVEGPVVARDAERMAARVLAEVLAERAPGRSVEVRVPPFVAVQCIGRPRHTRGTPPNVVEMSPQVWLRLAAGRTRWTDEIAAGRVLASGERADLSGQLPLL